MDSMKILSTIQREIKARGYAQVPEHNKYEYVRETPSAIVVSREAGQDTPIYLTDILTGIDAAKLDSNVYDGGPDTLREHGITHVSSPVWALLHLVPKSDY